MESPRVFKEPTPSEYTSPRGTLFQNEGVWYAVTSDKERVVPVPEPMAGMIGLSLRAQDKIAQNDRPYLEKFISVINCRKAALVAGGHMDITAVSEDLETDVSGLSDLFEDVERIQNAGFSAVEILNNYPSELSDYLDKYNGSFPCLVHVFEVDKFTELENEVMEKMGANESLSIDVVKRLHRPHSFVVLGEEENGYVCYQKVGPEIYQPFEITTLENIFETYFLKAGRKGVVFVGPVSN